MAKDINLIVVSGNLAGDPMKGKNKSTFFTVATEYSWKDGKKTSFVRVGAFNGLSQIVDKYLKKGKRVTVSGRLETSEYMKDGEKKYGWCIVANEISLDGAKKSD